MFVLLLSEKKKKNLQKNEDIQREFSIKTKVFGFSLSHKNEILCHYSDEITNFHFFVLCLAPKWRFTLLCCASEEV